ncbi:hypothetical protein NDU88_004603 [Pleurodeles waltl]|uniref:Uncharacterized protein n=1 Tax=Pleurodeles waltl TaxID=8319 RepID=A0AAV7NNY3_PLEWA|nr:hypothetical protein NDU88_004603 [Pleurodeles waltl]
MLGKAGRTRLAPEEKSGQTGECRNVGRMAGEPHEVRDTAVVLKRELALDVKDIRRDMIDLLRDKTADLNYQLEDLENQSRRCNIHIKDIPLQAYAGRLKEYVLHLFRHVAPELEEQDIILDQTHRAGRRLSLQGSHKTY